MVGLNSARCELPNLFSMLATSHSKLSDITVCYFVPQSAGELLSHSFYSSEVANTLNNSPNHLWHQEKEMVCSYLHELIPTAADNDRVLRVRRESDA